MQGTWRTCSPPPSSLWSPSPAIWQRARVLYGFGFPLDDAWIHQTYARNLACCGEWAFVPGDPSGGSTAPLWSLALSLGHALGLGPLPSGYGLGMAAWLALAWCCARWFALRNPGVARWPWIVGALVLVEWHLAWSAVSGMETLLFALLVVAVFVLLDARASWLAVGALVGLTVWVRPDALTLLLPVALHLGLRRGEQGERGWRGAAWFVVGLALLIVPYFGFNAALAGSIFPSTLAAKTAEYASLRDAPFLLRLLQQMALPLVGLLAVLLPGMLVAAWRAGPRRAVDPSCALGLGGGLPGGVCLAAACGLPARALCHANHSGLAGAGNGRDVRLGARFGRPCLLGESSPGCGCSPCRRSRWSSGSLAREPTPRMWLSSKRRWWRRQGGLRETRRRRRASRLTTWVRSATSEIARFWIWRD